MNNYNVGVYALCPCGSGKKFKFCCYQMVTERSRLIAKLRRDPVAWAKYLEGTDHAAKGDN
jgi:hypothetical protein